MYRVSRPARQTIHHNNIITNFYHIWRLSFLYLNRLMSDLVMTTLFLDTTLIPTMHRFSKIDFIDSLLDALAVLYSFTVSTRMSWEIDTDTRTLWLNTSQTSRCRRVPTSRIGECFPRFSLQGHSLVISANLRWLATDWCKGRSGWEWSTGWQMLVLCRWEWGECEMHAVVSVDWMTKCVLPLLYARMVLTCRNEVRFY